MDSAISAAVTVGMESIRLLNQWLDNRSVARAWFGDYCDDFITHPLFQKNIKINNVFVVADQDWKAVITKCLDTCQTWHKDRDMYGGECCWLPIYRAASLALGGPEKILKKADDSPSSIGSVSSRPAARLDSWGLIVMAFADGAKLQHLESPDYSFESRLDARDFILTVYQEGLGKPVTAHIEPRRVPIQSIPSLSDSEWVRLLWSGHTFEPKEAMIRWLYARNPNPPEDLVDGSFDESLSRTIIDFERAEEFSMRLRGAIFDCYDSWNEFLVQHTKDSQTYELGRHIQEQLLREKVALLDKINSSYCKDETAQDVTRHCHEHLRRVQEFSKSQKTGSNGYLVNLELKHRVLVGLSRLYTIPQKIPQQLSTRGTGSTLFLAGKSYGPYSANTIIGQGSPSQRATITGPRRTGE